MIFMFLLGTVIAIVAIISTGVTSVILMLKRSHNAQLEREEYELMAVNEDALHQDLDDDDQFTDDEEEAM